MKQETLTQERLKELLSYNQETGVFRWKTQRGKNKTQGKEAGTRDRCGYVCIKIQGKLYKAHKLAWLYVYGVFPSKELDHISGLRFDNRICNLREASRSENMQNTTVHIGNTSGYLGVCWVNRAMKWQAQIMLNGKKKFLGYWDTPEMADKAYRLYKVQIHSFNPTVRST